MKKSAILFYSISLLFSFSVQASLRDLDYDRYEQLRDYANVQGDLSVIGLYQRQNPSPYVILDKKNKILYVYDENSQRLDTQKAITYSGDQLDQGGSGLYQYVGNKAGVHYGRAQKDNSVHALFKASTLIRPGIRIYVIAEGTTHAFRIRNREVIFNSRDVLKNLPEMNYSPREILPVKTQFTTDRDDDFSKRYVQALQDEKPRLMKIFELDNDEYNMLAEFSYGVLAPETQFGTHWLYKVKETVPTLTAIFKGNGFDTSRNSRGPTQIKDIPELITQNYSITKEDLEIPENAAITTLGKCAEFLQEIRNRAKNQPGIIEETLQNYLYYLYQGNRGQLIKKTATPNFNVRIKLIREAIKDFHIKESF